MFSNVLAVWACSMWTDAAVHILRHCSALCLSSCMYRRPVASMSESVRGERAWSLVSICRRCSSRSKVVSAIIFLYSARKLEVMADVLLWKWSVSGRHQRDLSVALHIDINKQNYDGRLAACEHVLDISNIITNVPYLRPVHKGRTRTTRVLRRSVK